MIGSHLGSYEAMQCLAEAYDLSINFPKRQDHHERARALLNPEMNANLLEFDPENPSFVFEIQERLERGGTHCHVGGSDHGYRRIACVEIVEFLTFPLEIIDVFRVGI